MKCPRCQQENPHQAKFCLACATPLALPCANCGTQLPAGAKFCFECATPVGAPGSPPRSASPEAYTPKHLAERIINSKAALEGERKQITVLFADLKGSMELLADRDPEEARELLDPVVEQMMDAVHRYEGTVNQVMGDGIMALFGAPLAHEDHAVRACYAALRMQESVKNYAQDVFRSHGVPVQIRVGLNSGEVVVRSIGSDLRIDYTAVGQTTHLAARMEQMATPGTILLTPAALQLAEGYVQVTSRGPVAIKGLSDPVEVYELTGASAVRSRLEAAAVGGFTRFVGRDAEIDQLCRAMEHARDGHGQVVAVVGEPGVGKSRLFYEFTRSHRTRGWLILASASVSYGKATSYLPVIDLLKGYFGIANRDANRELREKVIGKMLTLDRALEPALPALLALLDVPIDDPQWQGLDPSQRRQRTLDAVKRLLLREAQLQPLLLVLEDLHWIDSETQALLETLVEALPASRLLLLVNYRPEYSHAWGSKTYYSQLRLDALPPESAGALLDALLGVDASVAPLKSLLATRTGGNPLFLEESVRALVETKALHGERGAYRLAQPLHAIQVPATVQAILAARIDRLPPEEKRLLETAAVIGNDIPFALLRAVADGSEEALRRGLLHLQAVEFLYETSLFPDLEYTFKHTLTHEVAYGNVLHERRRALHVRALEALERETEEGALERVERLAHHALRAERWDRAAVYLHQAGDKLFAHGAHASSAPFFEAAIDAVDRCGERGDRTLKLDSCLELWTVKLETGQFRGLRALAETAEALATSLGDRPRLAKVRLNQAQALWGFPSDARAPVTAVEHAREAFSLADPADVRTRSYARFVAGASLGDLGDFRASIDEYDQGVALSAGVERAPALQGFVRPIHSSLCAWRAESLTALGEFDRAVASGEEGQRVADEIGHPSIRAMACASLAQAHLMRGDIDRSLTLLERGLGIAEEGRAPFGIVGNATLLALARALLGEHARAQSLLDRVREAGASLGTARPKFAGYGSLVARTLLALQRVDDARAEVEEGLALVAAHGARGYEPPLLRLRAEILGRQAPDHPAGALRVCEQALALAGQLGMRPELAHCHLDLARLHRRTGMRQAAQEHLVTATTMYREMGMTYWLEKAQVEVPELE